MTNSERAYLLTRVRLFHTFVVVQLLSHVRLSVILQTAVRQASLSLTISQSLPKFMSIELVMPVLFTFHNFTYLFFESKDHVFPGKGGSNCEISCNLKLRLNSQYYEV